jgi:hypothetical protein
MPMVKHDTCLTTGPEHSVNLIEGLGYVRRMVHE